MTRRKKARFSVFLVFALLVALVAFPAGPVGALSSGALSVLLQDTYDTGDTTNINQDLATRQAGSAPPGTVTYTKKFFGPSAGTQQILNNQLDLFGFFVGTAVLDHDFTDADIVQNGGYSLCLIVSPTTFTQSFGNKLFSTIFALAMGQNQSQAGDGFPASNSGTDIGLRLDAPAGSGFIIGREPFLYDAAPALGKSYQLALTVAVGTSGFSGGSPFAVDLDIDGFPMDLNGAAAGNTLNGTWDAEGTNFISFSGLAGGWTVDNLKIAAGTTPDCELGGGGIAVEIDIKPGSDPNSINLKSKGEIPVAILTTDDFDATTVDGSTVTFEGASPAHGTGHLEDVDGDGDLDWVGHFKTQETSLDGDSTEGTLEGETLDGTALAGSDAVNIVPKKK